MRFSLKQWLLICFSVLVVTGCSLPQDQEKIKNLQSENDALRTENQQMKEKLAALEAADNAMIENPLTPSPAVFSDVTTDVPTADMINDLAQLKVFEEVGITGNFEPYKPITRAEYITWLYHAYNAMHPAEKQLRFDPSYVVPYSDIQPTDPAYKYVQAFGSAGFAVGYDDKTFKPNKTLTREEMIAIKYPVDGGTNGSKYSSNLETLFSDDKLIDHRFHGYVNADEANKDAKPRGNNAQRAFGPIKTFKPKEPVQRFQAAATLWQTDVNNTYHADFALGRKKSLSPGH